MLILWWINCIKTAISARGRCCSQKLFATSDVISSSTVHQGSLMWANLTVIAASWAQCWKQLRFHRKYYFLLPARILSVSGLEVCKVLREQNCEVGYEVKCTDDKFIPSGEGLYVSCPAVLWNCGADDGENSAKICYNDGVQEFCFFSSAKGNLLTQEHGSAIKCSHRIKSPIRVRNDFAQSSQSASLYGFDDFPQSELLCLGSTRAPNTGRIVAFSRSFPKRCVQV